MRASKKSGWTLIEVALASALGVLVLGKGVLVLDSALGTAGQEMSRTELGDQTGRVMDRIALAIMGSDRATLLPTVEGIHTTSIRYQISLGIEDGAVVWADREEIKLAEEGDGLVWITKPEEVDERRVVWANTVRELLEGELPNGVDDNGNGIVDENGLSFFVDGGSVTIRLSLERFDENGDPFTATVERVVVCRN